MADYGMKTVALLTGRGNNTLKDKNVLDVCGKPLLQYPAEAARKASSIQAWYCSSDDEKILSTAESLGYKRIQRPAELATPSSQHIDCIVHALGEMEKDGVSPEIIVVLLANNVTVKTGWIEDCVRLMESDSSLTAVVPVYEDNDHHPLRAKTVDSSGLLAMYEKGVVGQISTNRQDLPKCYFLAHNFWVLRVSSLSDRENGQPPWTFMGNRIKPYEIDHSIDVHSPADILLAEHWVKENLD